MVGWRWGGACLALVLLALVHAAPARADELADLTQQFVGLHQRGRYVEAADVARRAVAVAEARFGANHPIVAGWTNSLAETYRSLGRLGEAEPLYGRALQIWESALGRDHPEVATGLNNLALLMKARARFAEAERHYRRALAIWERSPGPESLDVARALSNLGELYRAQGRFSEAEPLYKRSISIRETVAGRDHQMVATALNNLALLETARGRHREAEALFKRALSIWEKTLGPDHPYIATAFDNLAEVYRAESRFAEAEPLYRRAIAIRESAFGPDHPHVATAVNNLALLLDAMGGRAADVLPLLERALAIREKALGPHHPDVAASLNNLAEFHRDRGRIGDAAPLYDRALAIWQQALGPDHPDVATAHNNLGNLYLDQQRHADAEQSYRRALAIRERVLGKDHPEVGAVLNNLAWLAFMQRDWAAALDLWRRSTELAVARTRRGGDEAGVALAGRTRSDAQREAYRFATLVKAAYRVAEASGAEPGVRDRLARETFEAVQWAHVSGAAGSLALMAARAAAGTGALAALVRERQDLVLERLTRDATLIAARSEPPQVRDRQAEAALGERLEAIDARLVEIDRKLAAAFPGYASLARPGAMLAEQVQAVLRDDEVLVLVLDTPARVPTPEETFLWVVSRTGLHWLRSDAGTATLRREVTALRCGLDSSMWNGAGAAQCRRLLGAAAKYTPGTGALLPFDAARAHTLHERLFGEARDLIRGKHLLLVPSGPLNALPLQALVTERPAAGAAHSEVAWLGTRHALTVLPAVSSLTALRAHARSSRASEPFIGFGNPLLTGTDGRDRRAWERQTCPASPSLAQRVGTAWAALPVTIAGLFRGGVANVDDVRRHAPLPETADELCAVARAQGVDKPDSVVQLGALATEARVKSLSADGTLARARIVHFATHGLIAGETAKLAAARAEPALMLTPPATASDLDDGLLTASEVAALKLDADWVILSACNTASGESVGGDALSGLARAFFYAGTRALLVSHWYVDSEATVTLVTGAFDAMKADPRIGRAEAMRRAMEKLIAAGGRMAHPASWAPFVVVGEGAAVR